MRNRTVPLFTGLLLLAVLPWTLAAFRPPQSPQDPFRQQMTWNFAILQYVNAQGQLVEVRAADLSSMRLLVSAETGLMRMELLHENNDYSSVQVQDFHLIRRSSAASSADVPVVRTQVEGMAFPAFSGK